MVDIYVNCTYRGKENGCIIKILDIYNPPNSNDTQVKYVDVKTNVVWYAQLKRLQHTALERVIDEESSQKE